MRIIGIEFTQQKVDLLKELLRTSFKLRYNNSVLGITWVLMKPLISFMILYFVFSKFRALSVENYQTYLLSGIMLYNFFSESVMFGMNSLLDKAHIILKVQFPKNIAVVSSLGLAFINMSINMLILIVIGGINGISPTFISLLYFLFNLLLVGSITYSLSLFTSIIAVKLRDLHTITEIFLQLGFYLCPIFYPLSFVNGPFKYIVQYNPMSLIIQASRDALIYGQIVNFKSLMILLLISLVAGAIGREFFKKEVKKIAEYY